MSLALIRRWRLRNLTLLSVLAVAAFTIACGSDDEAPATAATSTAGDGTVATAQPQATVAATTPPSDTTKTLTVARQDVGVPIGIPEACVPGCENEKFRMSVYENLFFTDAEGNVINRLGTGWTLAPDLSYLDITLREDAEFHQGFGLMTASDVAWTFNNANPTTNPDSKNDQAGEWRTMMTSMEALDEHTVRMNINTWQSHGIRHYLTPFFQSIGMHSEKVFNQYGPEGMKDQFIGTGPYEMIKWVKDDEAIIRARSTHWRQVPEVFEIKIIEVPEAAVRRAMLETGEANIAIIDTKDEPGILAKGFKKVLARSSSLATVYGGNYWEAVRADTQTPIENPGYDVSLPWVGEFGNDSSMDSARQVRQAMAMVIDRAAINDSILAGLGAPNYVHGLSINNPDHKDEWEIPVDVPGAKQLMADAGQSGGFDVEIWTNPGQNAEIAEAIAAFWNEHLNLNVSLSTIEYAAHRPSLVAREWNQIELRGCADSFTQYTVDHPKGLEMTSLSEGGTICGTTDPVSAALTLEAFSENDIAKRREIGLEFFQRQVTEWRSPSVVETFQNVIYSPNIIAWDRPLEVGIGGGEQIAFETIKLSN